MGPLLDGKMPCQIAVITADIEKAAAQYAAFLGTEMPQISTGGVYENTKCEYMGEPAKESGAKLAFFELGGIAFPPVEHHNVGLAVESRQGFDVTVVDGVNHVGKLRSASVAVRVKNCVLN